jgi:ABC-type nitrate/sulfonate/bicarbonate transport system substrate-binding protein
MNYWRGATAIAIEIIVQLGLAGAVYAQLRKINIAYTATSPYQAVLIVAKEVGLFKKHNLDPTLVFRLIA